MGRRLERAKIDGMRKHDDNDEMEMLRRDYYWEESGVTNMRYIETGILIPDAYYCH